MLVNPTIRVSAPTMATLLMQHASYIGQRFITEGRKKSPECRIVCSFLISHSDFNAFFLDAVKNKASPRFDLLLNKGMGLSLIAHSKPPLTEVPL